MTSSVPPVRVAVIAGSRRPRRRARAVAEWVCAARRPDLALTLVDLDEIALPPLAEPVPAAFGEYALPHTQEWARLIAGFDAFVLVSPEYNHSTTAVLKDALDHLYGEWQDKAVGFVGYGVDGGVRAVEHLRGITAELGMAGVGPAVALRLFEDFDDTDVVASGRQQASLDRMLTDLGRWGRALQQMGSAPAETPDAVVAAFVDTIQLGLSRGDPDLYDSTFAPDVLWGSPYGEVLRGHARLNAVHRTMMTAPDQLGSRYEVVQVLAPGPGVVLAQVRRVSDGPMFDEMALYVLVHDGRRWSLAAGHNTMVQAKPPSDPRDRPAAADPRRDGGGSVTGARE